MKVTYYKCDLCGREILPTDGGRNSILVSWRHIDYLSVQQERHLDLCEACKREIASLALKVGDESNGTEKNG